MLMFLVTSTVLAQSNTDQGSITAALDQVKNVQLHGVGNADAVKAMKVLNSVLPDQIPMLLEALDGTNAVSANWIRAAIQKAVAGSDTLPTDSIAEYFRDQTKNPQGRWLAWQIVCDHKPEFREQTISSLATDSSMPLREIGIAKLIADATAVGYGCRKNGRRCERQEAYDAQVST